MNKKEVIISAKLDSSDFDRSIKTMKDKLSQITAPADMSQQILQTRTRLAQMGLGPAPTEAERRKVENDQKNSMREIQSFIKEQVKQQDMLQKAYNTRIDQLKKLKELQEQNLKLGKEDLELKEKIAKHEASIERLRSATLEKNRIINQAADKLAESVDEGGEDGGRRRGLGQLLFNTLGASGIARAVIQAAEFGISYDRLTRQAQGAGMYGTVYGEARSMFSGNYGADSLFSPEKQKAMADALKEVERQAVLKRLAAGAAAGSALTLHPIGLGVAGVAAYYAGVEGFAPDSEYAKGKRMERLAELYQKNLEANKNMDPIRRAAIETMGQRYMSDLMFQRSLGMSNQEFRDVFLPGIQTAGFTDQMGMQSAANILAAGGSSNVAKGSAITSLKLQRQFDLTAADQILGLLGKNLGTSQATDQAVIRLLAEGSAQGMNKSELNKQLLNIASLTASMAIRSEEGMVNIARSVMDFTTENTMGGVERGLSAYQQFMRTTGAESGIAGAAMRYNKALTGGNLEVAKKLSEFAASSRENEVILRTLFSGTNELDARDPRVQAVMEATGLTFEQIAGQDKFGRASIMVASSKSAQDAIRKIAEIIKENPGLSDEELRKKIGPRLLAEAISALEYSGAIKPGTPAAEAESIAIGTAKSFANTGVFALPKAAEATEEKGGFISRAISSIKKRLEESQSGRIEDAMVAKSAEGLAVLNDEIKKLAYDLNTSIRDIVSAREMLKIQFNALEKAKESSDSTLFNLIKRYVFLSSDEKQPTTKSPEQ